MTRPPVLLVTTARWPRVHVSQSRRRGEGGGSVVAKRRGARGRGVTASPFRRFLAPRVSCDWSAWSVARPSVQRCGGQLAASRGATTACPASVTSVVACHVSDCIANNSYSESRVFPFLGGRKSARGGLT